MARFNEILVGRYNRMVQKLLSMKGPATLVTISDEAQAVFSLFYGVENRYLEGWDRFGTGFLTAAVVAQNSAFLLRNPKASNVLGVIEKLTVTETTFDAITLSNNITPDPANLATLAANSRLDARGRPAATCIPSFGNNAAGGNTFYIAGIPANAPYDFILEEEQEITLLPGDNLTVLTANLNVAIRIGCLWRERFLEDSERA